MYSIIEIPFGKIVLGIEVPSVEANASLIESTTPPFSSVGLEILARNAFLVVIRERQRYRVACGSARWLALLSYGISPNQPVTCIVVDKAEQKKLLSMHFIDAVLWSAIESGVKGTHSRYLKRQFDHIKVHYPDFLKETSHWKEGRGRITTAFVEQKIIHRSSGAVNR